MLETHCELPRAHVCQPESVTDLWFPIHTTCLNQTLVFRMPRGHLQRLHRALAGRANVPRAPPRAKTEEQLEDEVMQWNRLLKHVCDSPDLSRLPRVRKELGWARIRAELSGHGNRGAVGTR